MKLQDIPQPKDQYNHQIENKVAIMNFGHLIIENHTAKWVLL